MSKVKMRGPRTKEERRIYQTWRREYVSRQTIDLTDRLRKFTGKRFDEDLVKQIEQEVYHYCAEVMDRGDRIYSTEGRCINKRMPLVMINLSPSGVYTVNIA